MFVLHVYLGTIYRQEEGGAHSVVKQSHTAGNVQVHQYAMSAIMVIICQVLLACSVLLQLKDALFARFQQYAKTVFRAITSTQQPNFA